MSDQFVSEELVSLKALNAELRATLALTKQAQGRTSLGGIGGSSYVVPTSGDRSSIRARDVKQGGQNLIGAAVFGQSLASGDYLGAAYAGTGLIRSNKSTVIGLGRVAVGGGIAVNSFTEGMQAYDDLHQGKYKDAARSAFNAVATGTALAGIPGAIGAAALTAIGGAYQRLRPSDGGRFFANVFKGDFLGAAAQLGGAERDEESKKFEGARDALLAIKNEIGYLPSETKGMSATTVKKFMDFFDGEKGKDRAEEILKDTQEINRQISLGNTMDAAVLEAKLSVKVGSDLSRRLIPPVSTGERWLLEDTALRAKKAWSALYADRAQRVEYD